MTADCWKCGRDIPSGQGVEYKHAFSPPRYAHKNCEKPDPLISSLQDIVTLIKTAHKMSITEDGDVTDCSTHQRILNMAEKAIQADRERVEREVEQEHLWYLKMHPEALEVV